MTLVREPGSEIIAQFTVPTKGTWLNTAVHSVPLDAVYNSNNIFVREGKLRNRPGLIAFAYLLPYNSGLTSRHIIGGAMGIIPVGTDTAVRTIYAVSQDTLYLLPNDAVAWTPIPIVVGTPIANGDDETVDIAFLETSGSLVALFANSDYPLKQYITAEATIHVVTGTNIPTAKSICIAASRVIALTGRHTIVWSRVLDYTTYDPLAITTRAQTADVGICVRSLSALSFVLYKESSIHVARAQAGLDEGTAFAFAEPIIVEGPAGVYAVTSVDDSHIYMTRSGRIGIFNGTSRTQWIADGIWFYLQEDINQTYAFLIRATYDYKLNCVIFHYPRGSETTSMTGMVVVNLPFVGFEAQVGLIPYCFLGQCGKGITHVLSRRFNAELEQSTVFSLPDVEGVQNIHNWSEVAANDAGVNYSCSFQTGLQPMADARHMQVSVETFIERQSGYGSCLIEPVVSDTLDNAGGTVITAVGQTLSLEAPVVNEYVGFNRILRFFGLKYTWVSTSKIRYSGAVLYNSNAQRLRG